MQNPKYLQTLILMQKQEQTDLTAEMQKLSEVIHYRIIRMGRRCIWMVLRTSWRWQQRMEAVFWPMWMRWQFPLRWSRKPVLPTGASMQLRMLRHRIIRRKRTSEFWKLKEHWRQNVIRTPEADRQWLRQPLEVNGCMWLLYWQIWIRRFM